MNQDHPQFADGQVTQITEFPFDKVDRGNPLAAEMERSEAMEIASDGLDSLLRWIWSTPNFKFAFIKFVAMTAVMRPELLDDKSYHELAHKLACTKATISHSATEFQRELGVHFRRSRRVMGCENMRAARFSSMKTRGNDKFLSPVGQYNFKPKKKK